MAGVDDPTRGGVGLQRAVRADGLEDAVQLRPVVVLHDLVDAGRGPLVVKRGVGRVAAAHDRGDVQIDHRFSEAAAPAGLRDGLRAEAGRVGDEAVAQLPVQLIGPPRALDARLVARDGVILGVRHRVEVLAEAVAPLAQGPPVAGHGEIHPPARVAVDAVVLEEVQAAPAGLQPLGPDAVVRAEEGVDPAAASLHPDALVCGIDLALPVEAGVDAAVLPVQAVLQPEGRAPRQLILHPLVIAAKCLLIHGKHRSFLIVSLWFDPAGILSQERAFFNRHKRKAPGIRGRLDGREKKAVSGALPSPSGRALRCRGGRFVYRPYYSVTAKTWSVIPTEQSERRDLSHRKLPYNKDPSTPLRSAQDDKFLL